MGDHRHELARALGVFKQSGALGLWVFSDPERLPDPTAVMERLPRGAALVYRHFGDPERLDVAHRLADIAKRRRLVLLIGADWRLAAAVRADGVHLPAAQSHRAAVLKRLRPDWWVSVAAHSNRQALCTHADAIVVSPVFPTRSLSARPVLGLRAAAAIARAAAPAPVVALGGVKLTDARRLKAAGFAGLAGVDWALDALT